MVNGKMEKAWEQDWFFQDEQQAEEGKSFEKQIWGATGPKLLGPPPRNAFLHPVPMSLRSWPWAHVNPRTSEWNGASSCGSYTTYLKDPPPPFFSTTIPLRVEDAGRIFRRAYWEAEIPRFGFQGLKVSPKDDTLVSMKFTLASRLEQVESVFQSLEVYNEIWEAMDAILSSKKVHTSTYLGHLRTKALEVPKFRDYSQFWMDEWPRTNEQLEAVCGRLEAAFQLLLDEVGPIMSSARERDTKIGTEAVQRASSNAFGLVKELLRLVIQELQIHQHFVFQWHSFAPAAQTTLRSVFDPALSGRLTNTFVNDILPRGIAACSLIDPKRPEYTPPSITLGEEQKYGAWANEIGIELRRARIHLDSLRLQAIDIRRAITTGNTEAQLNSGLRSDVFRAVPKFSRRPLDKRRKRLVCFCPTHCRTAATQLTCEDTRLLRS